MADRQEHFTVSSTSPCTTCGGERVVPNLHWQQFYAETKNVENPDADAWARAHGFADAMAMGREEEICRDCDGLGYFQCQVPLADALKSLGVKVEQNKPVALAPGAPALRVAHG